MKVIITSILLISVTTIYSMDDSDSDSELNNCKENTAQPGLTKSAPNAVNNKVNAPLMRALTQLQITTNKETGERGKQLIEVGHIDLNNEETFTHKTFKHLIEEAKKESRPFIIARGETINPDGAVVVDLFSAFHLLGYLFGNNFLSSNDRYSGQVTIKPNPNNNVAFELPLTLYAADDSDKIYYLGSEYDLYSSTGRARSKNFIVNFFNVYKPANSTYNTNSYYSTTQAQAISNLAVNYLNGTGTEKNLFKARNLLERIPAIPNASNDTDLSSVHFTLGKLYWFGLGGEQKKKDGLVHILKVIPCNKPEIVKELQTFLQEHVNKLIDEVDKKAT